jgi:hypothetical protein
MSSRNEISKAKSDKGLTVKQEKFLLLYPEKLNVYRTAEAVGISKSNIIRDIQKDSPFGIAVRQLTADLENDPRFNKAGSIAALYEMEDNITNDPELEPAVKYRLLLDIRKEINKMIDGNIASQKKVVEKKNITLNGTYDFTKLPEAQQTKTIDISHKEID